MSAQAHLERCWRVARGALVAAGMGDADLEPADRVVGGATPLPSEVAELDDAACVERDRLPNRHGLVLNPPKPPGLVLRPVSATWDFAAFEVRSEVEGERSAVVTVPERQFEQFLGGVERGRFVDVLGEYLAQSPTNRVLESSGQTTSPGIYDSVSPNPQLLPPDMMGTGPGVVNPRRPGKLEEEDEERLISLPWGWIGAVVAALLVALVGWISFGGDEENLVSLPPSPTVGSTVTETAVPTTTPTEVVLVVPDGYGDYASLLQAGGVPDAAIGDSFGLIVEDEMGAGTGIYSRSDTTPGNFGDDVDQWDVIAMRSPLTSEARAELVGNTVFECGVDTGEFLTLCSQDAAPLAFPDGDIVVVAEIMVGDVAAEAGQWLYTYALVAETDGSAANDYVPGAPWDWDLFRDTDRWWVMEWDGFGWSMERYDASFGVSVPTAMRAVVRGNTILWLAPGDELPDGATFRTTSFRHDGSFAPAVSGADVIGGNPTEPLLAIPELDLRFFEDGVMAEATAAVSPTATATPEPSASATEEATVDGEALVRQFVARFDGAHDSGDVDFLYGTLDEQVLVRYGAEQCRSYLAATVGSISDLSVNGVAGPRVFTYTTDGLETPIVDIWSVDLSFLARGDPAGVEFNLHLVDGEIRWFTDCGEPLN